MMSFDNRMARRARAALLEHSFTRRVFAPTADRRDVMPDSKLCRGKPDRSVINMHEDYELRYWMKHLGVTHEQLKAAVDKVGNSAAAVRKQLGTAA